MTKIVTKKMEKYQRKVRLDVLALLAKELDTMRKKVLGAVDKKVNSELNGHMDQTKNYVQRQLASYERDNLRQRDKSVTAALALARDTARRLVNTAQKKAVAMAKTQAEKTAKLLVTTAQNEILKTTETRLATELKNRDDTAAKLAQERAAEQRAAEQRAADQRAADQRAADQRAADQRAKQVHIWHRPQTR